jgi:hypothetical protein
MTSQTSSTLTLVARDAEPGDLTAPRLLRQPDNLDRLLGLLERARREQARGAARGDDLTPYRELLRALKAS